VTNTVFYHFSDSFIPADFASLAYHIIRFAAASSFFISLLTLTAYAGACEKHVKINFV
jgi:hypothetical protein